PTGEGIRGGPAARAERHRRESREEPARGVHRARRAEARRRAALNPRSRDPFRAPACPTVSAVASSLVSCGPMISAAPRRQRARMELQMSERKLLPAKFRWFELACT